MASRPGLLGSTPLRWLFGDTNAQLERRVRSLPVAVERREGPACPNCGFGTLHAIPDGQPLAGLLRCDRPGCGQVTEADGRRAFSRAAG